jgi:hypothetical protein
MLPTARDSFVVQPSRAKPNAIIEPTQFITNSEGPRKVSAQRSDTFWGRETAW